MMVGSNSQVLTPTENLDVYHSFCSLSYDRSVECSKTSFFYSSIKSIHIRTVHRGWQLVMNSNSVQCTDARNQGLESLSFCTFIRYIYVTFWKGICFRCRKMGFHSFNPYPTAFPYGNVMVLHFYQQQESSTTKTVHKVINKGLKAYV